MNGLSEAEKAVFHPTKLSLAGTSETVSGYNFDNGPLSQLNLCDIFHRIGFQATNLAQAIHEVNRMLDAKSDVLESSQSIDYGQFQRCKSGCTIFLGYTSNLISSGLRDMMRFLTQHNMIDCIVTTAGGIEEDFIKCLAPTFLGSFEMSGCDLRKNGINRIGNLLVPNENYCKFEDWLLPILDQMLIEQKEQHFLWTPSKMIRRLGKEINNESSVYYWAYKNDIPVFCPALTDGSLGDMLYFHAFRNPGFVLDILEDLRLINNTAVKSAKTGMIVLGGGVIKHHICNANLMRNGADFSVFVNTGQEFDGSDSGARPDEAVSWGKIKADAKAVKVHCDATIAFPLLVSETFAKRKAVNSRNDSCQTCFVENGK